MKVILLLDVKGVGKKGDIKEVATGFGTNVLLPKKQAILATSDNAKAYEAKKKVEEIEREIQNKQISDILAKLNGQVVELKEKANEKGHLFHKVSTESIVSAVKNSLNLKIENEWLKFPTIKESGEHEIIASAGQNKTKFTLRII